MDYEKVASMLKAIADPNRLKIIDMLSCGSLCACDILEAFDFTQPTLSHHMKVLESSGVVSSEKSGKWRHYELTAEFKQEVLVSLQTLFSEKEDCICHQKVCTCKGEE